MRVEADRDICIGAGMCAVSAPEFFGQDDKDGRVVLLGERPAPEEMEAIREAISLCPSGALRLVDEE